MRSLEKNQDFCPRDMESCHLTAARRLKLWSLNANSFFEEPHQLTKYLLLTELEGRTVSYGPPSFFLLDLWPKREARGP